MNYVSSGKAFELECLELLKKYRFALNVVGKAGDRGVDLRGCWQLDRDFSVNVFIQCKNTKNKIPSVRIRELEGSLTQVTPTRCIGFLMANNISTPNTLYAMNSSKIPLGFMLVQAGILQKFMLNQTAQLLLPHFYTFQRDFSTDSYLRLFWKGSIIES